MYLEQLVFRNYHSTSTVFLELLNDMTEIINNGNSVGPLDAITVYLDFRFNFS